MAHIALAEMVGGKRNRNFHVHRGAEIVRVPQMRQSRIGVLLNDETGDISFHAAKSLPPEIADAPHIPLSGRIFDGAEHEGSSLVNVRKKGTTTPSVDTEAIFIGRGATTERIPKSTGFGLAKTRSEIKKEGKRKGMEKQYGQEVASALEGGRRRKAKKGGFGFASSPYEIAQARKEKLRLAKQARALINNQTLEFP